LTRFSGDEAVNSNVRRLIGKICLADWSLLTPESAWQLPEQQSVQAAVNSNSLLLFTANLPLTRFSGDEAVNSSESLQNITIFD
jgi:hypothetical protein